MNHTDSTPTSDFFNNLLSDELKINVWRYVFSIEFIEQENETIIKDIFNRINKNFAKLTSQELRHALFSGPFITASESLAEFVEDTLPPRFPNIIPQSKRQMKDVENVATMLLFIEHGEKSLSQSDIDKAFKDREDSWSDQDSTIIQFRKAIVYISELVNTSDGYAIYSSRLKNIADFYSLFAAIVELQQANQCPDHFDASNRLANWITRLRNVERGDSSSEESSLEVRYLDAARAASNDAGPRRVRIDTLKSVMLGH